MLSSRSIPNFIIYSNIFIAMGAAAFICETYLLQHYPLDPFYILLGFAATFFVYNIDRLVDLKSEHAHSERHEWIVRHMKALWIMTAIAFIWLSVSVFFLPWKVILFLAHLAFISVAYSLRIFRYRGQWISLRHIKALKIFLIAYVWMTSTVALPVLASGHSLFERPILMLMAERGLFIFAITIPFDVRDYFIDRKAETTTIPALIGIPASIRLSVLLLMGVLVLSFFHYDLHSGEFLAKAISVASTIVLVIFTDHRQHEYFYTGILDGTIIIQFLLVFVLQEYHW